MNEFQIGSLKVLEKGKANGIVTKKDFLRRVIAEVKDVMNTKVKEPQIIRIAETTCCKTGDAKEHAESHRLLHCLEETRALGDETSMSAISSKKGRF